MPATIRQYAPLAGLGCIFCPECVYSAMPAVLRRDPVNDSGNTMPLFSHLPGGVAGWLICRNRPPNARGRPSPDVPSLRGDKPGLVGIYPHHSTIAIHPGSRIVRRDSRQRGDSMKLTAIIFLQLVSGIFHPNLVQKKSDIYSIPGGGERPDRNAGRSARRKGAMLRSK